MATQSTYYLDAPSLGSATVIYSDVNLTIVAPDGFYSDGTISREQVSGSLLPQVSCPSCAVPCGGTITASGGEGVYYVDVELGSATGAVIITFDPFSVPDGILATFDSTTYNGLSSPNFGWLQGSAGLPTYIGDLASDCAIVANSPHILNEYDYDGTSFVTLGTTKSVTALSGQMQLTASDPGNSVMVIPKTTSSPSILSLEIIGPCEGTAFDVSVSCPASLVSFESSVSGEDSEAACLLSINETYYVAHVTGSAGVLGLYDLVFSDANGEFPLGAGFYATTSAGANDWFEVDANGVIVDFGICTPPPTITVSSVNGFMQPCFGGTVDDYMGADVSLSANVAADTTFGVDVKYVIPPNTCGVGEMTQSFTVVVPNGSGASNFDPCVSGFFVSGGATICSACITSCDDPSIDLTGFTC